MADKHRELTHKTAPRPFIEDISGQTNMGISFSRAEHIMIAENEGFWTTIRDLIHSNDRRVWYLIQFQRNKILMGMHSKNRFNSHLGQLVANLPIKPISYRLTA